MATVELTEISQGGVSAPKGFCADGIHAGFRSDPERLDMALVESDELCAAAGVFTQNVFCAAPVMVSREHLHGEGYGLARGVLINSGCANAATGELGLEAARASTQIAARVLGCVPENVLVASTGVIGQQLDVTPFEAALPQLCARMHAQDAGYAGAGVGAGVANADAGIGATNKASGAGTDQDARYAGAHRAAQAIMTTDTHPKEQAIRYTSQDPEFQGVEFCLGGMAKGSGMIMPNMATMIAVLTTDAPLRPVVLHSALSAAVNQSFNKVTVDSDTSTNDTCFILASGKALEQSSEQGTLQEDEAPSAQSSQFAQPGTSALPTQSFQSVIKDTRFIEPGSIAYEEFCFALNTLTQNLARMIARDGEGATKLITVTVSGATTPEQAEAAARTVANSPLVKTAVFGHDANWGRIAAALGRSGAQFKQENVAIDIMGIPVLREGLPVAFDEEEALRRFELPEVVLEANLGEGSAEATVWTCDFSYEYVTINGEYRT